jgi:hypothetical protein
MQGCELTLETLMPFNLYSELTESIADFAGSSDVKKQDFPELGNLSEEQIAALLIRLQDKIPDTLVPKLSYHFLKTATENEAVAKQLVGARNKFLQALPQLMANREFPDAAELFLKFSQKYSGLDPDCQIGQDFLRHLMPENFDLEYFAQLVEQMKQRLPEQLGTRIDRDDARNPLTQIFPGLVAEDSTLTNHYGASADDNSMTSPIDKSSHTPAPYTSDSARHALWSTSPNRTQFTGILADNNPHVREHHNQLYLKYRDGKRIPCVTRDTRDFTSHRLVSASDQREEFLLLDPQSRTLNDLYVKLKRKIRQRERELRGALTPGETLEVLNKFTRSLLPNNKIPRHLDRPGEWVSLREFVNEGAGVCRHHALLNCFFLDKLDQDDLISSSRKVEVIHHAQFVTLPNGEEDGHAWVILKVGDSIYSLDSNNDDVLRENEFHKLNKWWGDAHDKIIERYCPERADDAAVERRSYRR